MSFKVIPAIDLRRGRIVRLRHGDYAQETVFAVDPVELARRYADQGAEWLHVVDLDGARSGRFENLDVIESVCRIGALKVQCGGGVRNLDGLKRLFGSGAARAVIGSLAVRAPGTVASWIREFGPERVVLALDVRWQAGAWQVPVEAWREDSGVRLDELVEHHVRAGARHVLCTDIARDGMLGGFNVALYRNLHGQAPGIRIQASGGAASLEDIREARAAGADAVILGRALLQKNFALADALQC